MGATKLRSLTFDPELIAVLRADLIEANWTVRWLEQALTSAANTSLHRDLLLPASIELASTKEAAGLLTRLFLLAEVLPVEEVDRALPRLGSERAGALGLITRMGREHFRAAVDLRPHSATLPIGEGNETKERDWWVVSDLSQAQSGQPPTEDHVLGIAAATLNLLRLTVRRPVERALDLGCGSGILALYLATHAKEVVATDLSERACQFTRFNALLNEADIQVRQGSLFEPVAHEHFDLITSNPPFVITPQSVRNRLNLEYRDGGMERDSLIQAVIREGMGHLAPGGLLQMLANWEVGADEQGWAIRPTTWVEEGADPLLEQCRNVRAWLVQRDLVDAAQYVQWWMTDAHGAHSLGTDWADEYRDWLTDFHTAGTLFVGLGFLAVQVDQGSVETASLEMVSEYIPESNPADGEAVLTALGELTLVPGWEDRPLCRAEDVREVRYYVPGSSDPELIRITQGRAGGRERTVTTAVAALIGVSEGELSPAQVVPAIATLMDSEPEDVWQEVSAALPELLRSGVLRASS